MCSDEGVNQNEECPHVGRLQCMVVTTPLSPKLEKLQTSVVFFEEKKP